MVFSPVSSISYRRSVSPAAEGQARRDGHSGRLFTLQQREVANDDGAEIAVKPATPTEKSPQLSQASLEKWLRLMGAARQMGYHDEQQAAFQVDSNNMRYRLQRTYFDQERQTTPPPPTTPDQRLLLYRSAAAYDNEARVIDFVV